MQLLLYVVDNGDLCLTSAKVTLNQAIILKLGVRNRVGKGTIITEKSCKNVVSNSSHSKV